METDKVGRRTLSADEGRHIRLNLGRVAWLAILLGVVITVLKALGGAGVPGLGELLGSGLWPYLVCLGVAVGGAVAAGRPLVAGPLALLLTPAAFLLAKAIQKGVAVLADGAAPDALFSNGLLLEAGLRAVEYAVLGAGLAWLGRQAWGGALAHLGLGLMVGLLFGPLIAAFLPPDNIISWVAEELVFPIGCALIIYASETLAGLLPAE